MKRLSIAGFSLLAALGFTACVSPTAARGPQPPGLASDEDAASTELAEYHGHHHRGGVTQFVAMALDTLGTDDARLPEAQRLQAELNACMAPARAAQKQLHLTIADGVAAGAIDEVRADTDIAQLAVAAAAADDCGVGALIRLHALLSPAERAELVEKVQAHWEVWRQVNLEARADGREPGGRLASLSRELSLSDDQVARAAAALPARLDGNTAGFNRGVADEQVQTFAAAFVGDSFDGRVVLANGGRHIANHGAARMTRFYEVVTPILTPSQRTTLAAHLREHAGQQRSVASNRGTP